MGVIHIESEEGLKRELSKIADRLAVIDFTATWCGPCKMISPFFEELSTKYHGVSFYKVDVDQCQEVAMKYQVSAMPTFVYLKNGKEVDRLQGADKSGLEAKVKKHGGPNALQGSGFTGSGQKLGLNTEGSGQGATGGIAGWVGSWLGGEKTDEASTSKNEEVAQASLGTDLNLPNTKIQVRLADGTKLTAQVNLASPVAKIREFICLARPEIAGKEFTLNSTVTFPAKEIADESISIDDAGLANSVLVQKPKV